MLSLYRKTFWLLLLLHFDITQATSIPSKTNYVLNPDAKNVANFTSAEHSFYDDSDHDDNDNDKSGDDMNFHNTTDSSNEEDLADDDFLDMSEPANNDVSSDNNIDAQPDEDTSVERGGMLDDIENDPANVGKIDKDETSGDDEDKEEDEEDENDMELHGADDINDDEDDVETPFEVNLDTEKKYKKPIVDEKEPGSHVDQGDIMFHKCQEEKEFGTGGNLPNPECKEVLRKAKMREKSMLQQRDAMTWKKSIWNLPISYQFARDLATDTKKAVKEAIEEFEKKTCIKFTTARHRDRLFIYSAEGNKAGCWSNIGRQSRSGRQFLSLSDGCGSKNTALHEMMHALGFWHEISRADRNKHIQVLSANIRPQYKSQFKIRSGGVTTYGFGYDIKSTMHYDSTAFGEYRPDGSQRQTIRANRRYPDGVKLGQCRSCGLSKIDALQLNARYCNAPEKVINRGKLRDVTRRWMAIYEGESHDAFRNTLLKHLSSVYPRYYITASSFDIVRNDKHHGKKGTCMRIVNMYGRNVVVCYTERGKLRTHSWKQRSIMKILKRRLSRRGCTARFVERNVIHAVGRKFADRIRGFHYVKYGYNLRTKWNNPVTKVMNYQCGKGRQATLVVIFK